MHSQSWLLTFPDHPRDGPADLAALQLLWHRNTHLQQVRAAIGTNQAPQTWALRGIKVPGTGLSSPAQSMRLRRGPRLAVGLESLCPCPIPGWIQTGTASAGQQQLQGLHQPPALFSPLSKMISCPFSGLQEPTVIHLDST